MLISKKPTSLRGNYKVIDEAISVNSNEIATLLLVARNDENIFKNYVLLYRRKRLICQQLFLI
ncbi:hypothetical protein [Rickettsia hoogstraalii]|uniref:hypothetical protein n=1 Tax=Rickettsia hoogstraalii TaxID=467174 RepID=UPI000A9D3E94|nr:hypothetical protein [Rickettsia hoogstraalii]